MATKKTATKATETKTLKLGDVVRLKSGGPLMTVHELNSTWEKDGLRFTGTICVWFVNDASGQDFKAYHSIFAPESLEVMK